MNEDAELLRRYADEDSEEAFAELVRRHLNLVYFSALRQVGGDAHHAHDVAQSVFTDLARKARPLSRHAVLTGWLYTSTHFAAAKAVRKEQRRLAREHEAHLMQDLPSSSSGADWDRLRPVLDDVMLELNERDREAVLLRFFEGWTFADVGDRLRVTEDAARMRVERALAKLHALLVKRGVSSSTVAFSLLLTHHVGLAAPTGLAMSVTGAAMTAAAATVGTGWTAWATFIAMNKLPIGIVSVLAVTAVGEIAVQQRDLTRFQTQVLALQAQHQPLPALRLEHKQLSRRANEVEVLSRDDVELTKLREEISLLKSRLAASAPPKRSSSQTPTTPSNPASAVPRLDLMPRPRSQPTMVYPSAMLQAGLEGSVTVAFIVDAKGNVQQAQATHADVRTSPKEHPEHEAMVDQAAAEFGQAAADAVQQWQFAPGQKNGRSVNTRMTVPITFSLKNGMQAGGLGVMDDQASATRPPDWF